MTMTHYMELLATSQPWHLIFFMAIPVILAETIAVTELYILFTRNINSVWAKVNHWASILVGAYFTVVFFYLMNKAVIPITLNGLWRGPADIIAVGFYLLGVIPLLGMAMTELNLIGKDEGAMDKMKLHAIFVGMFLIFAHIAMIFGMLNPELMGYSAVSEMVMP